jgi:hypothetical protein
MNLKEALDYRRYCPFCHRPTTMSVAGRSNLRVLADKKGLRIQSKKATGKLMSFGHDGTYKRIKKTHPAHNGPLQILVQCSKCRCLPEIRKGTKIRFSNITQVHAHYKHGFVGHRFSSSLDNLKETGTVFAFTIFKDDFLGYEVQPQVDVIRYYDGESFYHWTTDFAKESTLLQRARFTESLENLFSLSLPLSKLPGLRTKEAFLNKFKTYTLFS